MHSNFAVSLGQPEAKPPLHKAPEMISASAGIPANAPDWCSGFAAPSIPMRACPQMALPYTAR